MNDAKTIKFRLENCEKIDIRRNMSSVLKDNPPARLHKQTCAFMIFDRCAPRVTIQRRRDKRRIDRATFNGA
ncbi:MAG TPA: hypothetical protein VMF12_13230 [Xanthobacteraceae bacterium]|nr:hypothetical protein [Xanthobacteraceae bacterium]